MLGQAAGGGGEVPGGDGDGPVQVLQMSTHRNLFSFYTQTDLLFVYQGTCDPVGNWFTVEPRYRSARLVDWAHLPRGKFLIGGGRLNPGFVYIVHQYFFDILAF